MSLFKKKLATFGALLAFMSITSASVYAVGVSDVLGHTSNTSIIDNGVAEGAGKYTQLNMTNNAGAGAVGQIDFGKFNIQSGDHVNVGYSNLSQTMIGRVLGGSTSYINGQLTDSCVNGNCTSYDQTGKFILINPAGVAFGAGSMVDLNSFTVSTFDFTGAKNLQNMTDAQKEAYQLNTLNKLSPTAALNGEGKAYGAITFDHANNASGFIIDQTNKNNNIIRFNGANIYSDKSFNAVADNISYTDSIIRTGANANYIAGDNAQSFSNVRLITGDGVTFKYAGNGYSYGDYQLKEDSRPDVVRNITMNNSGLSENAIESGDIHIVNKSVAKNSGIKIANTAIKANKMLKQQNGEIYIAVKSNDNNAQLDESHTVNIENSTLTTANQKGTVAKTGEAFDTTTQKGGRIYIDAGSVNVKDTKIKTAGSTTNPDGTSGDVFIAAQKNSVSLDNTKIDSEGSINVYALKNVNVKNGSELTAAMGNDKTGHNITISGSGVVQTVDGVSKNLGGVTIKDSKVNAKGDVKLVSRYSDNELAGNIIIQKSDSDGKDTQVSGNKVSIQGTNTLVDNANLTYEDLVFYNDGTTGKNHVTIARNTTFTPLENGAVGSTVNVETNGNLTFNNATAQIKDLNGNVKNADTLNATSTEGSVTFTNVSKITTNKNINVKANKNIDVKQQSKLNAGNDANLTAETGNVSVDNASVIASNNANLTSKKGAVNAQNSAKIEAGKNVNIKAYKTVQFGKKGESGVTIDNSANLTAGNNMNITSTAGDINAEKTTMPTLTYGNRLKFDAKGDNNFTSADSLKSVNVDYKAGGANKFYTEGDIQFVNSTLEAPVNFVESGHDVILNSTTIKQATTNAKDTVTEIYANGNVTTDDVTGTASADVSATPHKFPQSVSTVRTGKGKTTLDINQTKLKITTQTVKDPANPNNGSITLDLKNANNPEAGVKLTAINVDKLDKDPTGGNFKTGYYKEGTSKWDENVGPNEGPEVHLNAVDNEVAVEGIETDKLFLDPNDKLIADTTNGTPVIEVKDEGGLNIDPDTEYPDENPDDQMKYSENYDSQIIDQNEDTVVDTKVTSVDGKPVVTVDKVTTEGETTVTTNTYTKEDGTQVTETIYTTPTTVTTTTTTKTPTDTTTTKTSTTTVTTTYRDKKHTVEFDNDGNPSNFILVYDKTRTETEVKTPVVDANTVRTWAEDVKVVTEAGDPIIKIETTECAPLPDVQDEVGVNIDSLISQTKLPREQVEVSKTSKVSDNTIDQTSNIMSAAAKVDIVEDEDSDGETISYNSEK